MFNVQSLGIVKTKESSTFNLEVAEKSINQKILINDTINIHVFGKQIMSVPLSNIIYLI